MESAITPVTSITVRKIDRKTLPRSGLVQRVNDRFQMAVRGHLKYGSISLLGPLWFQWIAFRLIVSVMPHVPTEKPRCYNEQMAVRINKMAVLVSVQNPESFPVFWFRPIDKAMILPGGSVRHTDDQRTPRRMRHGACLAVWDDVRHDRELRCVSVVT